MSAHEIDCMVSGNARCIPKPLSGIDTSVPLLSELHNALKMRGYERLLAKFSGLGKPQPAE